MLNASITTAVSLGIALLEDRGVVGPWIVHIAGAYLEQIDPVLIDRKDVVFAVTDQPFISISTTTSDVTVRLTPATDVVPPLAVPGADIPSGPSGDAAPGGDA